MIVADTNLVAYLLIEGPKTELARLAWSRDSQWMMPNLWRSEFLNVLVTSCRAGVLTPDLAHDTWHRALTLFAANEVAVTGDDVLDVAERHQVSGYDAQFVVVAIKLDVHMVTADRRLLAACPNVVIPLDRFARP